MKSSSNPFSSHKENCCSNLPNLTKTFGEINNTLVTCLLLTHFFGNRAHSQTFCFFLDEFAPMKIIFVSLNTEKTGKKTNFKKSENNSKLKMELQTMYTQADYFVDSFSRIFKVTEKIYIYKVIKAIYIGCLIYVVPLFLFVDDIVLLCSYFQR